jgi:selenocysteine lyase/cysteine desulfurase
MKAGEIDSLEETIGHVAAGATIDTTAAHPLGDLKDLIVGGHTLVPTIDGSMRPYVNLDSAASTPIAAPIKAKVDEFLEWYAAVHRGSGFKSMVASAAYEEAREIVARFVGADLDEGRVLIFVRNTTEAINRCAGLFRAGEGDVVLTTLMEHHSNLLAWRRKYVQVESIEVDTYGAPVLSDLQDRLRKHEGHVKLVAISGGSNVTGVIPDVHAVARVVHEAGALLLVDAAQLAPHRPIDMGPMGAPDSIDFLAMSAHKMYAPLGCGALIGPRSIFKDHVPDLVGGGTVLFVSEEEEMWKEPPDSEEAGSPNVVGAVAMAAACHFLERGLGWNWIIEHERDLTGHALARLNEIPGLTIYGPRDPSLPEDRLGVISFNLAGHDHRLVAAILSHEHGVGTRTGCFCAHPYIMRLFHLSHDQVHELRNEMACGDRRRMPGAVRISFGFYNTRQDIDAAVDALWEIQRGNWSGTYHQDTRSGEYMPDESGTDPAGWFRF